MNSLKLLQLVPDAHFSREITPTELDALNAVTAGLLDDKSARVVVLSSESLNNSQSCNQIWPHVVDPVICVIRTRADHVKDSSMNKHTNNQAAITSAIRKLFAFNPVDFAAMQRTKKEKLVFVKCECCGNPSRQSPCHKCSQSC